MGLFRNTTKCPKCKSLNVEYLGSETIGARPDKVKTTTSINLNPLKPITLFNHKEKVVKKGSTGVTFDKWHCKDCGKIFKK